MSRDSKKELISQLIAAYRANTSQESAFDALAAEKLGLSLTDLRCLDLVQATGGMTAGELATSSGLTTGAVTAVIDRLERAGYVRSESRRLGSPQGERGGHPPPLRGGGEGLAALDGGLAGDAGGAVHCPGARA